MIEEPGADDSVRGAPAQEEPYILGYEDFRLAVEEAAGPRGGWDRGFVVSLPGVLPPAAVLAARLVAFVCRTDPDSGPDNPRLYPPMACAILASDGELLDWRSLPPVPTEPRYDLRRFGEEAAAMAANERQAFLETYYELLVSEEGPLFRPWTEIDPEIRRDLRTLRDLMVEPACIAPAREHAGEFVSWLERGGVDS